MSKVIVEATGSCMYTKGGDTRIRISKDKAVSLRGLAEAIEEIHHMLSVIYHGKMQRVELRKQCGNCLEPLVSADCYEIGGIPVCNKCYWT